MSLYSLVFSLAMTLLLCGCGGSSNDNPSNSSSIASAIVSSSSITSSSSSKSSLPGSSSSSTSSSPATACSTQLCESNNKELVRKIYEEVINKNNTELLSTIFDAKVNLHSAVANGGVTGEIAYIQLLKNNNPNAIATIKHIAADGDYVAVHWHLSNTPANEFTGSAVVDLYKVSANQITEHWTLSESLNATTASGNSLFSDLFIYKTTKPAATQASELANKSLVTSFYLGLFNDKDLSLIDKYVDPDYLQHNPYVPNGREALRSFASARTPGGLSFFATISDDDLVWTFGGNSFLTLVDIFRVADQKIVEHYDVF